MHARQTCTGTRNVQRPTPRCWKPGSIHHSVSPRWHVRSGIRRLANVSVAALKGVLCDLDGVIYNSGTATAIPGAAETVQFFRDRNVPWVFVTNTNTKTREGLATRLRSMGVPCTADDVVTPAKLAADWLRLHDVGPAALFVASELVPEFEGIPQLPPTAEAGAAAVVIGDMGLDWNYETMNRAFRLVMEGALRTEASGQAPPRPSCLGPSTPPLSSAEDQSTEPLKTAGGRLGNAAVSAASSASSLSDAGEGQAATPRPATGPLTILSLGKGRYYKDTDGYNIDVGPFTAAIEYATDQEAVILGKPDPLIFCLAARSLGLEPEEVVMIGDDVRGDVGGAQAAGLRGVLVRTGKFRKHDLLRGIVPDAVLPSIAQLPAWWEAQQQREEQRQQAEGRQQLLLLQGESLDVEEPVLLRTLATGESMDEVASFRLPQRQQPQRQATRPGANGFGALDSLQGGATLARAGA